MKVDCSHCVESRVRFPHGHEDLSHRVDVLLHDYLVDELVVGSKESCADLLIEDL